MGIYKNGVELSGGGVLSGMALVVASDAPTATIAQAQIMKVQYGALVQICDGVTDDVEIQAAIDAVNASGGGIINFTKGTFICAAQINLKPYVSLQGQGAKTTTLQFTPAAGNCVGLSDANSNNISIFDIKLYAIAASTGWGITSGVNMVRDFHMDRYEIEGFKSGISLQNVINSFIGKGRLLGQGEGVANGIGINIGDISCNALRVAQAYSSNYEKHYYITQANGLVIEQPVMEVGKYGIDSAGASYGCVGNPWFFDVETKTINGGGRLVVTMPVVFDAASTRQENVEKTIAFSANGRAGSALFLPRHAYLTPGELISAGNFALGAGWGANATVTAVAGTINRGRFQVNSIGVGQTPNPVVAFGPPTSEDWWEAPFAIVSRNGGNQPAVLPTWATAINQIDITFPGTPVAGESYKFEFIIMG
jgi:hypothetical protein